MTQYDESILLFRPGWAPRALLGPERIDLGAVLPAFDLTAQHLFASLTLGRP
jgi:hypothetical protein